MLVAVFILGCVGQTDLSLASSPSGSAVFEKVSKLWVSRDFAGLDGYLEALQEEYPGYCPVTVASTVTGYLDGLQYEHMAKGMTQYRSDMETAYPLVPPYYMHAIKDAIDYASRGIRMSESRGLNQETRLKKYHRDQTLTTRQDFAKYEVLFVEAPLLMLPMSREDVDRALRHELEIGKSASAQECKNAIAVLKAKESTLEEKKTAVETLRKRVERESLQALEHILKSEINLEVSTSAAAALIAYGNDAVPFLLSFLKSNPSGYGKDSLAVWALVRSGVRSPEVLQAVITARDNHIARKDDCELALRFLDAGPANLQK